MRTRMLLAILSLCVLSAGGCKTAGPATHATAPVVRAADTRGTPDERADALLRQMTLREKVSLISGDGFVTHPVPRLGIPSFTMSDGPQGVRNGPGDINNACAFPCGAALAATWDADLAAAYGRAMGLEGRARGTHFQLGPGLNICRVPVNGRNFEYFGEDPYLASVIAANWVKACAAEGVVPTVKHFAANDQETRRDAVDTLVDERTMQEVYLPAFKAAVQAADGVAVMCSYNRLNGHYTSNNAWLLTDVLKNQWGFKGLVMSDWGASHDVTDVARGLDLEMPTGANLSWPKVQAALANGTVKEADIDRAVHRLLRTALAMGWMDAGWMQKDARLPLDSPASAKVALDVAREAIVLLKNEHGALPLDRAKVKNIVVLGPNATAGQAGELPLNVGGGGSGSVDPFPAHNTEADYFAGIIKAAGPGVKVTYLPMPAPPGDQAFLALANARTGADGQAGLTLQVQVTGEGEPVTIPAVVQKGIDATWTPGQLPFGVPAGRDATYTWSGVLLAPADGDWELLVSGRPAITLEGKPATGGDVVHLTKDKPVAIQVTYAGRGNVPARSRNGARDRSTPRVQVALVPPRMPDVAPMKAADALIVCVGYNRYSESEGRDRAFDLPGVQEYLIRTATAANPRTIVINNSGAAVAMADWQDQAAAVVQAWYLGQEGGTAIGEVLFGDVNPSGRLCSTFDRSFAENPAFANYPGTNLPGHNYPTVTYAEGLFHGYRGYDKAGKVPLYPFGYGLSYTTFELSNLQTIPQTSARGPSVKVTLDVRNTGQRTGAEVVEIYVGEQGCPTPRPLRELKGFAKVTLTPGQTKQVEVVLDRAAFSYWSPETKGWVMDAGKSFTIEAAESERAIGLTQTVTLP